MSSIEAGGGCVVPWMWDESEGAILLSQGGVGDARANLAGIVPQVIQELYSYPPLAAPGHRPSGKLEHPPGPGHSPS